MKIFFFQARHPTPIGVKHPVFSKKMTDPPLPLPLELPYLKYRSSVYPSQIKDVIYSSTVFICFVSAGSFAETAPFMPAIKILIQQATSLNVMF
jgi:hypothetical protein